MLECTKSTIIYTGIVAKRQLRVNKNKTEKTSEKKKERQRVGGGAIINIVLAYNLCLRHDNRLKQWHFSMSSEIAFRSIFHCSGNSMCVCACVCAAWKLCHCVDWICWAFRQSSSRHSQSVTHSMTYSARHASCFHRKPKLRIDLIAKHCLWKHTIHKHYIKVNNTHQQMRSL